MNARMHDSHRKKNNEWNSYPYEIALKRRLHDVTLNTIQVNCLTVLCIETTVFGCLSFTCARQTKFRISFEYFRIMTRRRFLSHEISRCVSTGYGVMCEFLLSPIVCLTNEPTEEKKKKSKRISGFRRMHRINYKPQFILLCITAKPAIICMWAEGT